MGLKHLKDSIKGDEFDFISDCKPLKMDFAQENYLRPTI
jgi:hypothetical protein